ncbi:hypothetical protein OG226_49435 [Streptomyces sp. NBC_01261]|uniref:hypothetical protein n=1 Tax=unclassified Streptomyces TaxID=2593676 RepID=UPI002E2C1739|nr:MULTISPECIES: hypothetical protein [unclassified Streptomyces]
MSTPNEMYGPGSQQRMQSMQAVYTQTPTGQTGVIASIYLNGSTQPNMTSQLFLSGTRAGRNSRYSWAQSTREELSISKNDAEVKALDWAYAEVSKLRGQAVGKIGVDLTVNNGTCNGCKERQSALVKDLEALFPGSRAKVIANYPASQDVVPGRGGTTSYGYAGAQLKSSAAGQQTNPGAATNHFFQATHRATDEGFGSVAPQRAARAKAPGTSATWHSDADSPHVTPSPPNSSPTAEEAVRSARNAVQQAANALSKWDIAVTSAKSNQSAAEKAYQDQHTRKYNEIRRATAPGARESQAQYQQRVSKTAADQIKVFDRPVAEAKVKVAEMERGRESARQYLAAATTELTRAEAHARSTAAPAAYSAGSTASTSTKPHRG